MEDPVVDSFGEESFSGGVWVMEVVFVGCRVFAYSN